MVAITSSAPVTVTAEPAPQQRFRHIGIVPTASMITGAFLAVGWFWIPLSIFVIGISSIPSIIGFLFAGVVFIYLMLARGWSGQLTREDHTGLEGAAIYWHFVDIVWIGLFATLYLLK